MKALTILCAAVLGLCSAAFAYQTDVVTVHFATPVAVGETTLPAGDVTITIQHGNPTVMLTFRSESGVTAGAVATRINGPANDQRAGTQVILERGASGYKVQRVWLNNFAGFELAQ